MLYGRLALGAIQVLGLRIIEGRIYTIYHGGIYYSSSLKRVDLQTHICIWCYTDIQILNCHTPVYNVLHDFLPLFLHHQNEGELAIMQSYLHSTVGKINV